ncbi:NAD(P)/FAD-dependent oxidoreductase [Ruminococcaceae bacterium OttesenSCG-928-I18]|nr:NAD(P)/FAD-dependent oxidoreductase [Ruminococcaceae bacterium OttesenSCG-928-I18]
MPHLLVVGAGAAGLFAAGTALKKGHEVTLVEHMDRPGKKLCITGKGRCNLTNDCDETGFFENIRRNPKFLYSAINKFPPRAAMRYFEEELSVPLKVERGHRVFPQSDRAEEVVQALVHSAKDAISVRGQATGLLLEREGSECGGVRLADGRECRADAVLLSTGGLSYPATGSTGLGYEMARQAGHAIVPPVPSLVALREKGTLCKRMQGLSLRNVTLTLFEGETPHFREQGELLFTHFGLSGPLTLSASAYVAEEKKKPYHIEIDLKPALSAEKLDARLQRDFEVFANRNVANCLDKLLPKAMRGVMVELWGVDGDKKTNQLTREERRRLGELIKHFRIEIEGKGDLAHAVVTSGGVDVRQVNPRTMESKLCKNLYFAGEVLDVDGYTGGFNLQIAWATAWAAACSL